MHLQQTSKLQIRKVLFHWCLDLCDQKGFGLIYLWNVLWLCWSSKTLIKHVLNNWQLKTWSRDWNFLTHSFPMHPFSAPDNRKVFWCFQWTEKGLTIKKILEMIISWCSMLLIPQTFLTWKIPCWVWITYLFHTRDTKTISESCNYWLLKSDKFKTFL